MVEKQAVAGVGAWKLKQGWWVVWTTGPLLLPESLTRVTSGATAGWLLWLIGILRFKGQGQQGHLIMGQCVPKCKKPSSTLGNKNGDRDPSSKSHNRQAAGHHEEQPIACCKPGGDILINGTKNTEATTEACQLPTSSGDARRKPKTNAKESSSQRLEELFRHYKDEQADALVEGGVECFCSDLCVDPTKF